VTLEKHQRNLADVAQFLPGWMQGDAENGRASLRATTPDRLPYIGEIDIGLWVSTGHGSRGFLSAPLAAEIIASAIFGEQAPVTQELLAAVNPLRFTR
jgi:tRNA 5-methylaminomethyl-2-thiouridine biosynthesis bifunctional protein